MREKRKACSNSGNNRRDAFFSYDGEGGGMRLIRGGYATISLGKKRMHPDCVLG